MMSGTADFEAALRVIGPKVARGLAEAYRSGKSSIDLTQCSVDLDAVTGVDGEDRLVLDHRQAVRLIACLWADGFAAGVACQERVENS